MTRGARETKGEFFEFFEEAKRAIAESEVSLLSTINQASARDWRAAAWLLSARFPSRWSADARTQTAIRDAIAVFLKDVEWFMQPKIYQQLLQAAEQVRGTNLVPSKMTELEAIKVLLDARWLPADLVKRIGEAYGNFQEAVINTFVEGLAEQKK